jgi:hypothetical protein
MPLTWNTANIANHNEVDTDPYDDKSWHPVCTGLVWLSLHCGFNEITQKNHEEVAQRIAIWQKFFGAYLGKGSEKIYITNLDVQRYIGLRTNAPRMTKTQFNKRIVAWATEAAPGYIIAQFHHNGSKTALDMCAKEPETAMEATA